MADTLTNRVNFPFVSIIIPVYNDARRLDLCLEALGIQSYPQKYYEVLIIDNGSEDDVDAIVRKHNVNLIKEKQAGSYRARNCGIRHSKGEIIGFTDSDCLPASDWVEIAVQHFQENRNSLLLSGKINVTRDDNKKKISLALYDQIYHFNQENFSKHKNFAATANLFCRREVFEMVGLFNERFYSFGDVEFGQRIKAKGLRIDYNRHLIVNHPQINSYKALWERSRRLAGGGSQLRKQKGYGKTFEMLYILFSIIGTPFIISNRFMYKGISSFRERVFFSWISLIVHVSKSLELIRLLLIKKKAERK